jgi:hypothetical protein
MLEESGDLQALLSRDAALAPEAVADAVWQGLQGDELLILPHPEVREYYAFRAAQPDAWLGGMNKLQRRLEDARETR